MRIVTLLENETDDKSLGATHGLSLYIETNTKKILFDLGPNNYYKKNAKKLGVRLDEVDYLVVSHGHNDHGTGIKQFLKLNKNADVILSKRAFEEHLKQKGRQYIDIGIGKRIKSDRIKEVYREHFEVSPGIFICDEVNYEKQIIADKDLKIYEDGQYVEDHFHHEIYLVVKEDDKTVLFSGCSHKGIENIVDSIEKNSGMHITHIFGGLHFKDYDSFNLKQTDYLINLAEKVNKRKDTEIYACHCTGEDAFFELKQGLKAKLHRLKTGTTVEI